MNILVLGVGLQGQAAVRDLANSPEVESVIAADADQEELARFLDALGSEKVRGVTVDAADEAYEGRLAKLMDKCDAVVHLLPPGFRERMARLAVGHGCHFVDASYALPVYEELHEQAVAAGVAILPEFGLDPGIDLVLMGEAARELDTVHRFLSYGAGIPEPAAADNALRYKISWSFAGVLRSYRRPATVVQGGRPVTVPAAEIFAPEHGHTVEVSGLGKLEAFPNGDVRPFLQRLGIDKEVQEAGRYTLRWPGHCAFWYRLAQLGLLDEEPVTVDGQEILPQRFLHDLLAPQLQYKTDERDVAYVAVEAEGFREGRPHRVRYQVLDLRDLETGLLAMQRTVGFTAGIGAQMLLRDEIPGRGLLSPLTDVPAEPFLAALLRRGIGVEREVSD